MSALRQPVSDARDSVVERDHSIGAQARSAAIPYAPHLDGLRAIAILGVLVFHTFPAVLEGGFAGVDVFFVLSGYLITSVVLRDLITGEFSFRRFYLRRILRLVPNAVAMILVTIAISAAVILPSTAVTVAKHGAWALFNLSNVFIWRTFGGYWGDQAASAPLLHTWSLAVEEQFYLILPALLWFSRRGARTSALLAAATLASFALGVVETRIHSAAAFYLLPTRAWEPLLGAMFASIVQSGPRTVGTFGRAWAYVRGAIGWSSLALTLASFVLVSGSTPYPGVAALMPTIGALGVIAATRGEARGLSWLLSRPPLVFIGTVSYSLYLWHWPLIVLGGAYAELTGHSATGGRLLGACVGVLFALAAYWGVEAPLRAQGSSGVRRLPAVGLGFAVACAVCLGVSMRRPVSDPLHLFDPPTFRGVLYNVGLAAGATNATSAARISDVIFPNIAPRPANLWESGGVVHTWGGGNPRVVVLGSSHALMYAPLIDDVCRQLKLSVAFLTADSTSVFSRVITSEPNESFPSVEVARAFDSARWHWLSEWRPDAVLVIDRWDDYSGAHPGPTLEEDLATLAAALSRVTAHVIVFSQVPTLEEGESVNLREFVNWKFRALGHLPRIAPDSKETFRQSSISTILSIARRYPSVELLRADEGRYLPDGSVRYADGRSFLYMDDDHLTDAGAEALREGCESAIARATANRL